MSDWIITAECNACQETVPINELRETDDGHDCPRCGKPFYWEPADMVDAPCDDCGRVVRWPAGDDQSRGVMCHPCIRRLLAAS